MTRYLFQLGHCPDLSHAEIAALSARTPGAVQSLQRLDDASIAECRDAETVRAFCEELGGTIRAAEILGERPLDASESPGDLTAERTFEALIDVGIDRLLMERSKRPIFGVSMLGLSSSRKESRRIHSLLHETAASLKERLRELGASSRFVLPDPKDSNFSLNGAQVEKNNLLDNGMEIVLHIGADSVMQIANTVWLQHYEEFSERDYGRPGRDSRSGMLPPKLARLLINLARTTDTKTILDPFCGSGGILTEAAIMGLQTTGFDTSKKAIQDTIDNWKWMQEKVDGIEGGVRALVGDARTLHTLCEPLYFDACVSEPYLGPPTNKPLDAKRFESLSKELVPLYLRALGEIRTVVKEGARVVFVVPRFRLQGEKSVGPLPVLSEIKLQGYTILDPFSDFTPTQGRTTLIYSRPKQVVQREIFILKA